MRVPILCWAASIPRIDCRKNGQGSFQLLAACLSLPKKEIIQPGIFLMNILFGYFGFCFRLEGCSDAGWFYAGFVSPGKARQGAAPPSASRAMSRCWRKYLSPEYGDEGERPGAAGFVGLVGADGVARSECHARTKALQAFAGNGHKQPDPG
jgi:hypothetical protein